MANINGSTNLGKSTTVGIVVLLIVVTGWVGVTALHAGQPSATPGIVVRESRSPSEVRPSQTTSGGSASETSAPLPPAPSATEIVVHVAGAVKKPGVYHLKPGARNIDAVDAAGGFTAVANSDAINLAALSVDSSQIYIPTRAEQPSGGSASQSSGSTSTASPSLSGVAPVHSGDAGKSASHSSHSSGKFSDPSQGQVNLNTADAEQLQHIPGVGPAMAERILAYRRTAGRFQSTDEILQISGIGDKKYQKMKPFMTVR